MSNLVIVESPAKTATIKGYLSSNYKVEASVGHIRDLPKSALGIDVEHGFEPHYINIRGKGDIIRDLKNKAKAADRVFLATDPDREGEAISWHLAEVLGVPESKCYRVTFNELTSGAVKAAIKNPRQIDMNLVNSQQTRRILDRIVGYKLTPFLWKSVRNGLSAGRVQSVATKILVDRENEINAFVPVEYWTVTASLETESGEAFTAEYLGEKGRKTNLPDSASAEKIKKDLMSGKVRVTSVRRAEKTRIPAPPFTTSTLQQEAGRKLGFQSSKTMKIAQELYEGINIGKENGGTHGLITYMRTDSLRISDEADAAALSFVKEKYGDGAAAKTRYQFKSKAANQQDAHEAIRPTDVRLEPQLIKKYLTADQFKLYRLIWSRFIATRMAPAVYDTVRAEMDCGGHTFVSNGSIQKSAGYLAVYDESSDVSADVLLPDMKDGDAVRVADVACDQHFTEPPQRFTEASLVKFFEETGIGRPSTYAPIISTIIQRGYVKREGKTLRPTELGFLTNRIMTENFGEIVDVGFTSDMETKLDRIAAGTENKNKVLSDFYGEFTKSLDTAEKNVGKYEMEAAKPEKTGVFCEKCGGEFVIRTGRFGKFAACSNYPECRNTKRIDKQGNIITEEKKPEIAEGMTCPECGGKMIVRSGRYGSFFACENYPTCKYTVAKEEDTGVKCPECGGRILVRHGGKRGSVFYGCENYPKCGFSTWNRPTGAKCPKCGSLMVETKGKGEVCMNKNCGYSADKEQKD